MSRLRSIGLGAGATLLLVGLAGCGPAPIEAVGVSARGLVNGLVGHWAFDEGPGSGTTVSDRSGNGPSGQISGSTWSWQTAGRFAGGLRLQPGDSVTIPNFRPATADWTVSVWIYLTAADRATLMMMTERAVLLTAEKSSMGGWEIEFDPRPGFDYLEASYYVAPPTNGYPILECRCIEVDRWMHWTMVFDWTNRRTSLYRGAVLVDTHSAPPAQILPGDTDLNIGRWAQGVAPDLRRHRRLRHLEPRAQCRRGRRHRRDGGSRPTLTLRAVVEDVPETNLARFFGQTGLPVHGRPIA